MRRDDRCCFRSRSHPPSASEFGFGLAFSFSAYLSCAIFNYSFSHSISGSILFDFCFQLLSQRQIHHLTHQNRRSYLDMQMLERKVVMPFALPETNKINKSIYAILSVSRALSSNEGCVPYQESKLTHMLQDSLRGTSRILIVACLEII
ncbi:hypothetical protein PIB30_018348 [Stylosanthes scabra]|uniref:Kinesin motor domain-containing protein n=1 Tax=Stylosanthes scabra TaxID=79078 RepID=A0ABU6Q7V9_9FABA|nr:hypothetical protein [Stylosanthes scabra]